MINQTENPLTMLWLMVRRFLVRHIARIGLLPMAMQSKGLSHFHCQRAVTLSVTVSLTVLGLMRAVTQRTGHPYTVSYSITLHWEWRPGLSILYGTYLATWPSICSAPPPTPLLVCSSQSQTAEPGPAEAWRRTDTTQGSQVDLGVVNVLADTTEIQTSTYIHCH